MFNFHTIELSVVHKLINSLVSLEIQFTLNSDQSGYHFEILAYHETILKDCLLAEKEEN